jgi:DNA-binding response OmpR family regulator
MKEKILIADDNQFLVEILKSDLELLNYEVSSAKDGEEALELMKKFKPDLLILDIMMPKYNGYQVCRRIKNDPELKDTIVIMLTAKTAPDDKLWGLDCGADVYLTKPFETEELENIIRKKLDERKKGKITHPVTGLPLIQTFEQEKEKRFKAKTRFAVLRFFYKNNCIEDIESIYGKFCAIDILAKTAKFLTDFINGLSEYQPFLAFSGDNCFHLIINAEKEKVIEIGKKCTSYLNNLLSTIDISKNAPTTQLMERTQPVIIISCAVQLFNQK